VVEDPAWPRLADAIGRAHAAGWKVYDGLPRLVAQQEMPDRHPARELHYRLLRDCPAATPTPPRLDADTGASVSRREAPPRAAPAPEVPAAGRAGPGR
jgi:hypothetical protein